MSVSDQLREIATWMRSKADETSKQAASRQLSDDFRNATVAELKQSKALAERMAGRTMPLVSISLKDHKAYCYMQDRIREKLETEAKRLSEWADFLEAEAGAKP